MTCQILIAPSNLPVSLVFLALFVYVVFLVLIRNGGNGRLDTDLIIRVLWECLMFGKIVRWD